MCDWIAGSSSSSFGVKKSTAGTYTPEGGGLLGSAIGRYFTSISAHKAYVLVAVRVKRKDVAATEGCTDRVMTRLQLHVAIDGICICLPTAPACSSVTVVLIRHGRSRRDKHLHARGPVVPLL